MSSEELHLGVGKSTFCGQPRAGMHCTTDAVLFLRKGRRREACKTCNLVLAGVGLFFEETPEQVLVRLVHAASPAPNRAELYETSAITLEMLADARARSVSTPADRLAAEDALMAIAESSATDRRVLISRLL